ncbi:hypothetical protein A2U01_0095339, partial [Trifolium medium]|nr:hypothetical protein [Trifolium medium]
QPFREEFADVAAAGWLRACCTGAV